jgi:pimeloyl-ACP methyl ester carboxylesterase
MQMCLQLATDHAFEGDLHWFATTYPQMWDAYRTVLKALKDNPDERVTVIGYSWGGAAALELAQALNEADPKLVDGTRLASTLEGTDLEHQQTAIDDLVLMDPVLFMHAFRSNFWTPAQIPDNVKRAANFYASETQETLPVLDGESPAPFLNGVEHFDRALNVEIANTNHFSIDGAQGRYNRETYQRIRDFLMER